MSHTKEAYSREALYDHIYGGLMGAALGDAMGAATEQHGIDEILAEHKGMLRELIKPAIDTFSESEVAGLVTDDSSQMFALAQALIDTDGDLTIEHWTGVLLHWSIHSPMRRQMGPTTRPLLEALSRGESTEYIGTVGRSTRKLTTMGNSNGAAMRVAPAGLVYPGDIESAVRLAWTTCQPTHDTQISGAGAGAIAAGCAAALVPGADVYAVAQACLEGARLGDAIGRREGRYVAGPSIVRRIEIAIEEALRAPDFEAALRGIEAAVGNSVMMVESAPAAVGIFVAAKGDPLECAVGGTNIGNDTDTIAAMAGAMAGALHGIQALPQEMVETISNVNEEDVPQMAEGLTALAWRHSTTA